MFNREKPSPPESQTEKFTSICQINTDATPLKIKLLPENIAVVFEVSVENFNKIDESDFLIEIDYDRKNEVENYMIPQLIKFPETVLNIELRQEKVNYLILK